MGIRWEGDRRFGHNIGRETTPRPPMRSIFKIRDEWNGPSGLSSTVELDVDTLTQLAITQLHFDPSLVRRTEIVLASSTKNNLSTIDTIGDLEDPIMHADDQSNYKTLIASSQRGTNTLELHIDTILDTVQRRYNDLKNPPDINSPSGIRRLEKSQKYAIVNSLIRGLNEIQVAQKIIDSIQEDTSIVRYMGGTALPFIVGSAYAVLNNETVQRQGFNQPISSILGATLGALLAYPALRARHRRKVNKQSLRDYGKKEEKLDSIDRVLPNPNGKELWSEAILLQW